MNRWVVLLVGVLLGSGCGSASTAHTYWPQTACPAQNTQDADDVCLITHPYQTSSNRTSLSAFTSTITDDGRWVAVGGIRYDGAKPTPVLLVEFDTGAVTELAFVSSTHGVAFSPDGTLLAAGGVQDGQVGLVRVWKTPEGAPLRDLTAPIVHDDGTVPENYYSVRFSPDGRQVIAGRSFGDVVIWDVATGTVVRTLTPPRWGDGPGDMSLSADGATLAVAAQFSGPYVTVYDLATGTVSAELDVSMLDAQNSWPQDVALSPDGTTVAIAADCRDPDCVGVVWLWDLRTQAVRPLRGHVGDAISVVFHPDGRWLASGGMDNSIRIWDWRGGVELDRMDGAVTAEWVTGTPAPGVPAGAGGLGSATQGFWAPVGQMRITADGRIIVYSESANGQTRVWRLPARLWQ